MDVQEEIGTHEDTPGRTRNLRRNDIIYCKYCNRLKKAPRVMWYTHLLGRGPFQIFQKRIGGHETYIPG